MNSQQTYKPGKNLTCCGKTDEYENEDDKKKKEKEKDIPLLITAKTNE